MIAERSLWGVEKRHKKSVCPTLDKGVHYVEFWAKRSPILHQVTIETQPTYEGDFWLNPCIKIVGDKLKPFLGVYIEDDDYKKLTNDNLTLFYKTQDLPLGINANDFGLPGFAEVVADALVSAIDTKFDFSGHWLQEGHWFYYGVDRSWKYYQEHLDDTGILDYSNWKLIRK